MDTIEAQVFVHTRDCNSIPNTHVTFALVYFFSTTRNHVVSLTFSFLIIWFTYFFQSKANYTLKIILFSNENLKLKIIIIKRNLKYLMVLLKYKT